LKAYLFNINEKERTAIIGGLRGIAYKECLTTDTLIHVRQNTDITILNKNLPVEIDVDTLLYIQSCRQDRHMVSLIQKYCQYKDILMNDSILAEHQQSTHKTTQMLVLALEGINTPDTMIFRADKYTSNKDYILKHVAYPCVLKEDGSRGRNVFIAETVEQLEEHISNVTPGNLCMIQEFIQNSFDTRTICVYDKVHGSISRSRMNGYLNNISLGGIASEYTLSEEDKALAIRAAKVCRIDLAGIDMIHTQEGTIVLEVNRGPGTEGYHSVHEGPHVYSEFINAMVQKLNKRQTT
jgi:RimK family alpha-L-glutamate ligase